jgi:hypothetical protein
MQIAYVLPFASSASGVLRKIRRGDACQPKKCDPAPHVMKLSGHYGHVVVAGCLLDEQACADRCALSGSTLIIFN